MRGRIFRTSVFSGMILLCATPLALAEDPATTDAVYACAEEADDLARLACYDAAVGRLQAAEEAGEIATITREDVEEAEKDSFGLAIPSFSLPGLSRDDDERLEEITEEVTAVDETPFGKLIVTLANGQVWEQTDSVRVSGRDQRSGTATIERGAIGSYWLRLGDARRFRAKRIS